MQYIKKYIVILLILILVCFIYDIYIHYEPYTNIKRETTTIGEQAHLIPILRLIYPEITFVDNDDNELLIKVFTDPYYSSTPIPLNNNKPYIYFSAEANKKYANNVEKPFYDYAVKDTNCVGCIVTTQHPEYINDKTFYVPLFLSRGIGDYTSSPFYRKYTNNNRERLAAFIASHSVYPRNDMFTILHTLDNTVDALGNANNTHKVKLPDSWWDLPDIYKDYMFGFAMENVNEKGYITEKIMNVFIGGAIPIYWGTSMVKEIFNPDAFIYVNDYPSLKDAANDIIAISKDPYRLQNMLQAPIFLENSEPNYSNYYNIPPPLWVKNIADKIKNNIENIKHK